MSREELDEFLRIVKDLKERSQFMMEKMSNQVHK